MKKTLILLFLLVFVLMSASLFAACGGEEPADEGPADEGPADEGGAEPPEPVVLTMTSAALFQYADWEQQFVDAFNARCGPDYTIDYYPSEQMVPFAEILDSVRTGVADMGAVTFSAYSANETKLAANEIPFLFNNVEANAYAAPLLAPLYSEIMEGQFNQKVLCVHHYTGVELISKEPVQSLEDWDGLLVQAISPTTYSLIEALGAAPVLESYTESYGLLEKNTVEAVITAPAAMNIFGLPDVASYMSQAYPVGTLHGFTINLDVWNSLPSDIQDALLEEAQANSDELSEWLIGEWDNDLALLADSGVTVYVVPADEIDKWKDAASDYIDELLETLGDFGAEVVAIADEANALYPR